MARKRTMTYDKMDVPGQESDEELEIDLLELLYRVLENLKYIIAVALIGAVLMGVYTKIFVTPMYEATAKLYVLNQSDSAINLSDLQIGSYLTEDYQEVFKTWEVHHMVIERLGLDYTYAQIQQMLSVTNPNDTRILYITATSANAQEATDIANAYTEVAKKYISETMATEEPNILSEALLPSGPVSPSLTRNVVLGFLGGGVLAGVVVVILFLLDDKIRTAEDISKYAGIPTLAAVPTFGMEAQKKKGKEQKSKKKGAGKR